MSTKDQLLFSALHGTAIRYAAEHRDLTASIDELRKMADGRNDILAKAAGDHGWIVVCAPSGHVGHELVGWHVDLGWRWSRCATGL